jgi:YD repeat-containing protein
VLVTADPGNAPPENVAVPAKYPGSSTPVAVGVSATHQYFMSTVYDQFGDKLSSPDGVHPNLDWTLYDQWGKSVAFVSYAQTVDIGAQAGQVGRFTLKASNESEQEFGEPAIEGSVIVNYADIDAPSFSIALGGSTPTGRLVSATGLTYAGNTADLEYTWSFTDLTRNGAAYDPSYVAFSNNGTPAGANSAAIFREAGTYAGTISLTVTDPHNRLNATHTISASVTLTSVATALRVTPSSPSVAAGGSVLLTATEVDQFGAPVTPQPSQVTWTMDGVGQLTAPSGSGAPTGLTAKYFPGSSSSLDGALLATVHASVAGIPGTVNVPIHLGAQANPIVKLVVDTTADTLLGAAAPDSGGGGESIGAATHNLPNLSDLIDRPEAVRAVISDPGGGTITWTLTATPQGQSGGTVLLTGTGAAGTAPSSLARIGTITPGQLPDGVYTLTLKAEANDAGSITTSSASQIVQIRSAVKLGNLTLPVTDLTENVPNGQPITVSRAYDSQRSGQETGLGYGWTLDALAPALTTTEKEQYDGQGPSLAWSDLVYVTVPGVGEHVFAFRPTALIDTNRIGAGFVLGVTTYKPTFVAVDGTSVTLKPCDADGVERTDDTLLWDSANGYMFKSADNNLGYNPALKTEFGGYYLMTDVDGTRYVVNAATGRLHSQTDVRGRTQTFADGPLDSDKGKVQETQDGRTFVATPTWGNDNGHAHITSIVYTDEVSADTRTVAYGYDSFGNLTSAAVKDSAGQPVQSTQYVYDDPSSHLLTGVIDGRGIKVMSAAYDPTSHQLTQLSNVKGTAAKASSGYSGDTTSQTTTAPSGTQLSNQFDEHGNVIRSIKTVMDSAGKTPLYYVVTVSEYDYASPDATDEKGLPLVNFLQGSATSTPFVVSAARASDRNLDVEALVARGYLKTDQSGNILWATKQSYNQTTRLLASSSVLQSDGTYLRTNYIGSFVFGKPTVIQTDVVTAAGNGINTRSTIRNTYGDVNGPDAGLLTQSTNAEGLTTYYLYGGDEIPGTGNEEGGSPIELADAPAGRLYGTYQRTHDDGTPIFLTRYEYFDVTTATAATPAGVTGLLKSSTDAAGLVTSYTYYPDGRTAQVSTSWADGSHVQVQSKTVYDALGRVKQSTDAYNHTTTITYDGNGQTLDTTDVYGRVTHNVYDAAGNLVQTIYPDGTEQRTVYDGQGRVLWQTDRFASATTYNASTHAVTQDTTTTANASFTSYDASGNVVRTERHAGVLIAMAPDAAAGGVAGVLSASLASKGTTLSATSTVYDALGRVVETIDTAGLRTGTIYYDNGEVHFTGILKPEVSDKGTSPWYTATLPTDDYEHPTRLEDFLNSIFASYTTYAAGESTPDLYYSADANHYRSVTDALGHETRQYNDATGRTAVTRYPDGSLEVTYHNRKDPNYLGRPVPPPDNWDTARDGDWDMTAADGWVWRDPYSDTPVLPAGYSETVKVAQRKPHGVDATHDGVIATIYLYDAAGRLTDVWLPAVNDDDPASPTHGQKVRPHWTYVYDPAGNEVVQVSPREQAAFQAWIAGDAHSAASFTGGTSFTYDNLGHQLSRRLPDGETETFTYDSFGRPWTHTDFDSNVATSTYYPAGNAHAGMLQQVAYVGETGSGKATQTVSYTYDELGRQKTVTDASGLTTYTYDANGQVTQAVTPEGTIHYDYDPATGRHVRTYTDNTDVAYGYDAQGRLSNVYVLLAAGTRYANYAGVDPSTHNPTFTGGTPLTTTDTYDPVGNKSTEMLPDGVLTTWGYDTLNRLTSVTEQRGTASLFAETLILNDDGSRHSAHEVQLQPDNTTSVTTDTTWAYDDDGRLTGETVTSSATGENYANVFGFDLGGNRVIQTHTGPGGGAADTVHYTYNGDDQLTVQTSTRDGETDYTYDFDGSQTDVWHRTANAHDTFGYDVRNKMTRATVAGATATYVYDDAGNRVQETAAGATTYYLTDANTGYAQPIEEKSSPTAAPTRTYVLADRVLAQANATGPLTYLLNDAHGSTQQLATATGQVTKTFRYDAFGGGINFTLGANAGTEFLFGGDAIYDPASGLYLHGDGVRGRSGFRFIEADGQGYGSNNDPLSLHKYLYANGDPETMVDPTGHNTEGETLTATGGMSLLMRITLGGIKVFKTAKRVLSIVAAVEFVRHPEVAQDFIGMGGNPAELAEAIFADVKALVSDLEAAGKEVELLTEETRLFKLLSPRVAVTTLPLADAEELAGLAKFRSELGLEAAPGENVVAKLRVGDSEFFGINAHGQPLSVTVNPISATHAEIDTLNQAKIAGATAERATLYVDRAPCGACDDANAIGSVAAQVGIRVLEVIYPGGRYTIVTGKKS